MSKSLFDNLKNAVNNHSVIMTAANAQNQSQKDDVLGQQIGTLKEDITALTRDFSERYPDLLNAQSTLNGIDRSFNDKAAKGFNKTAAGVTVRFENDKNMEGGGKAAVFHMGNPEHGHELTVTSTRGMFYDGVKFEEALNRESDAKVKLVQLENMRKLTGVAHNYIEYGEHVVNVCTNQLPVKDDAVKKAMETGVGLEEAIQAANTFDF